MDYISGNVIVIDDSETIQILLKEILSEYFTIHSFLDPFEGLKELNKNKYDCVILDLMMPGMSGLELLEEFRRSDSDTPVLILTAKQCQDKEIARFFQTGASDFVTKPFLSAELTARINHHIKLKKTKEELLLTNQELQKAITREEKLNEKIIEKTVALKRSIYRIKILNRKLKYFATHDKLTGFLNRRAFFSFLDNDIKRLKRINSKLSVLMLDLDLFKHVNDTYGHLMGDYILMEFSGLIRESVRDIDLVGRYGGEEFLVLLADCDLTHAMVVANKLREIIENHVFSKDGITIKITTSIGVAEYSDHEAADKFISRVDEALYRAKKSGRNKAVPAE